MASGVARVHDPFCNLYVKVLPGHVLRLCSKNLDHPFYLERDTERKMLLIEVSLLLSLEMSTGGLTSLALGGSPHDQR